MCSKFDSAHAEAFRLQFHLPGKQFPTIGARRPNAGTIPSLLQSDLQTRTAEFQAGITLDLQPFPGTLSRSASIRTTLRRAKAA